MMIIQKQNQLSRIERWSTYAVTVDRGFKESLVWIQENCQEKKIDHHKILAGWCLSLSQASLLCSQKCVMCSQPSCQLNFLGSYLHSLVLMRQTSVFLIDV